PPDPNARPRWPPGRSGVGWRRSDPPFGTVNRVTGSTPFPSGLAAHRMTALGLRDPSAVTPGEAVGRLVAMQAQEHPVARWSVAQRVQARAGAAGVDAAFDSGDLLRTHVLRP